MAKDIGLLEIQIMKRQQGRIKNARLINEKEELENLLSEEHRKTHKRLIDSIIDIWKNFDELCLSLSRLDGKMSFREIASLNVYEFYNLKRYLEKIHRPKNTD